MLTDRWWSFFLRWTKGAFWFRKMQDAIKADCICVKRAGEDSFFFFLIERVRKGLATESWTVQEQSRWKSERGIGREGGSGEKWAWLVFCSAYQIQTQAGNENWCRSEWEEKRERDHEKERGRRKCIFSVPQPVAELGRTRIAQDSPGPKSVSECEPDSMSDSEAKVNSKKAGIRAAVILIGLLHKSRRQREKERDKERWVNFSFSHPLVWPVIQIWLLLLAWVLCLTCVFVWGFWLCRSSYVHFIHLFASQNVL